MQSGNPGSIEYIRCPNLKSLEFFYAPAQFNAWRTFFRNHPKLQVINLREGRLQDYTEMQEGFRLMQLISTQNNLHTFKMHNSNLVPVELMKKFIAAHAKLRLFYIYSTPLTSEFQIMKMPNGEWRIHITYDKQLVFAGTYDEYETLMKDIKERKPVDYEDDDDDE